MSLVHIKNLGFPRNQRDERPGLFRTRRSRSGHYGKLQNTQGNHAHAAIHYPIQQEPQTRGLEGYGSSALHSQTAQMIF
ncbi:hypothetical protein O181_089522 [Austropuccinia psidii MF-1]|uniref:Uncharacterized protein n=1 Tax=Austropuccinia psidii MF-1 TaxID=1389203 RepID=A0A9Q3ITL6_9BASI|nr:hypothetical protein [Austropuccinia psidii MF-1]